MTDLNATGIIVEYNPFHNGHKYHLKKAKEISDDNIIIAVMSGDFVQRGEPAIINKWKRAEIALKAGVDLVVELPVYFSTQSAEIFSLGAISILDSLKVDKIVFGSETSTAENLIEIYKKVNSNIDKINEKIKTYLKSGVSYPSAISKAYSEILNVSLDYPNDILGFEYIKAIDKINSDIKPISIERHKSGYYSKDIRDDISSATYIRELIKNGKFETARPLIPKETRSILFQSKFVFNEHFFEIIKYEILKNYEKLPEIQDIEYGFENRLYKIAKESNSYEKFLLEITSKRYTQSRINRILNHLLLGITNSITTDCKDKPLDYIKILGMNRKGVDYLSEIKKELEIPLITNYRNIKKNKDQNLYKIYNFNENASRIYNIISNNEFRTEAIRYFL